uniref:Putative conserved protein with signal anchor n=1 Tax=Phlebotomus kandelakii TaxID=1109342 RepID=A0A6B2EAQ7_9DIPT
MTLEESRRTQRPYRYGMILLCFGALANWLGLAENYSDPIRYLGVACIIAGALLICTAMCCWLHTPPRTGSSDDHSPDPSVHIIGGVSDENRREKPPDYDTVAVAPPSYDDAIKLTPAAFLHPPQSSAQPPVASTSTCTQVAIPMPTEDSIAR